MTQPENIACIVERLTTFDQRLQRIVDNPGGALTVAGQATAISMLVILNLNLFGEAAAVLTALTGTSHEG